MLRGSSQRLYKSAIRVPPSEQPKCNSHRWLAPAPLNHQERCLFRDRTANRPPPTKGARSRRNVDREDAIGAEDCDLPRSVRARPRAQAPTKVFLEEAFVD